MTPDLPGLRAALAPFTIARGRTRVGRLFARSETAPEFHLEAESATALERQITAHVERWAMEGFGVKVERRVYPPETNAALAA